MLKEIPKVEGGRARVVYLGVWQPQQWEVEVYGDPRIKNTILMTKATGFLAGGKNTQYLPNIFEGKTTNAPGTHL